MKSNFSSIHTCKGTKCHHSTTFSKFKKTKTPRQRPFGKCNKWRIVPDTSLYDDFRPTVTCSKCKNLKTMHFVHDDDYGDYSCPDSKCEIMGYIRYLCLHCGRSKDSVIKPVDEDSD